MNAPYEIVRHASAFRQILAAHYYIRIWSAGLESSGVLVDESDAVSRLNGPVEVWWRTDVPAPKVPVDGHLAGFNYFPVGILHGRDRCVLLQLDADVD